MRRMVQPTVALRVRQPLDRLAGISFDEQGHEVAHLPVRDVPVRVAHDLLDTLPGESG